MTIDEAIKHCLEVVEEQSHLYSLCPCPCDGTSDCMSLKNGKGMGCTKCAAEHRQLAEWLMEYKDLKAEQNDQKEAKRLLKLAVEGLERLGSNEICFSGCDESCPFDCVGRLEEKHWKYLDEALKLIKEE